MSRKAPARRSAAQARLFDEPATRQRAAGPAPAPTSRRRTAKSGKAPPRRENAQTMAARQREISVSEFFTKNRHLLGFDNPRKALMTTGKLTDGSFIAAQENWIELNLTGPSTEKSIW